MCSLANLVIVLNESSCTMVLKLRRLDGKVTDTGREFQILGPQ